MLDLYVDDLIEEARSTQSLAEKVDDFVGEREREEVEPGRDGCSAKHWGFGRRRARDVSEPEASQIAFQGNGAPA
jgi:hypothetical protein